MEPPNIHGSKTTFDEAIFQDSSEAGLGVVIRNHEGDVMVALLEKIPLPSSAVVLEMLAARHAVLFVHEVGLHDSIMEGDSEIVINSLTKGYMIQSSFGHLVKDTSFYVHSLRSFCFSHTFRQGNFNTDALFKRAKFSSFSV